MSPAQPALSCAYHMYKAGAAPRAGSVKTVGWIAKHGILWGQDMRSTGSLGARISVNKGPVCVQVGKDAVVIEADAIKNRDVMFKHLSSNDFTKNDPMLSSYVHEYSTKAAEMLLAAAGTLLFCLNFSFNTLLEMKPLPGYSAQISVYVPVITSLSGSNVCPALGLKGHQAVFW